jgi:hypothetical protein
MPRRTAARIAVAALSVLALLTMGTTPAAAAPPANDDFDNAVVIAALPFGDTTDTTEATTAPDDPFCAGNGRTVWYTFTPSADIDVVADTFGSDYDTTLSAYTGTRGALHQVACNDDSQSLQSRILFHANAGVTQFLMVGSFDDTPGGTLTLSVRQAPPRLQTAVSIDPAGSVDRTGVATIHGTVTCSRQATVDLFGILRQQVGKRVAVGSSAASLLCPGASPWTMQVVGETGAYRRGDATAVVTAQSFDPERGELVQVRDQQVVHLS